MQIAIYKYSNYWGQLKKNKGIDSFNIVYLNQSTIEVFIHCELL